MKSCLGLTLAIAMLGCTRKIECESGFMERGDECVETSPRTDGGTDAGRDTGPVPDAPLADAPPDSSTDTGVCTDDRCGAECVDLQNDDRHCGMCDHPCTSPLSCLGGACVDEVVQLSVGSQTTCVVKSGGSVSCWGRNDYGQVGDGSMTERLVPTVIAGALDAVEVGTNGFNRLFHTCARQRTGSLLCWGTDGCGELGDGTASMMPNLEPAPVVGVSDAVDLGVGADQTCAVRSGGSVACWGCLGEATSPSPSPTAVVGIDRATSVSVGWQHACAVLDDGDVVCWGDNAVGQLGDGTTTDSPSAVTALLAFAVEVGAGFGFTCARIRDGGVQCWGTNDRGQLGTVEPSMAPLFRDTPMRVPGLGSARQLAVGVNHACALVDGGVACWGASFTDMTWTADAYVVDGLEDAIAIGVGAGNLCAQLSDGRVLCLGDNLFGQIGDGTTMDRGMPTPAVGFP